MGAQAGGGPCVPDLSQALHRSAWHSPACSLPAWHPPCFEASRAVPPLFLERASSPGGTRLSQRPWSRDSDPLMVCHLGPQCDLYMCVRVCLFSGVLREGEKKGLDFML